MDVVGGVVINRSVELLLTGYDVIPFLPIDDVQQFVLFFRRETIFVIIQSLDGNFFTTFVDRLQFDWWQRQGAVVMEFVVRGRYF